MRLPFVHTVPQATAILPPLMKSSQAQKSAIFNSPALLKRLPFGIAFDVDGVVLRGREPIGGSRRALRRLYDDDDSGTMNIPFLFLTNGGCVPEARRAVELTELLGVKVLPSQVVQGHSSFRTLLGRYQNELIIATGKGEPALVMSEYGFNKVLSLDEYASYFDGIDPVSQFKNWTTMSSTDVRRSLPVCDVYTETVKAAFVVSDPVDWGRDIQVLCDILRSGRLHGKKSEDQPPLYFAANYLEYQAAFPAERLGVGAFRIALESIFIRVHHKPLEYTIFGKPNPLVFKNVEAILRQLHSTCNVDHNLDSDESRYFRALYMIGDNPSVDIKGAKQAGHPWISVLTRTGIKEAELAEFCVSICDSSQVVDTMEDAIEYILEKELL